VNGKDNDSNTAFMGREAVKLKPLADSQHGKPIHGTGKDKFGIRDILGEQRWTSVGVYTPETRPGLKACCDSCEKTAQRCPDGRDRANDCCAYNSRDKCVLDSRHALFVS
jgi:hypothetical protein